ncbi:hypothetical protein Avbf_08411 [Armadillidium vulgare]|nr:hypothetical protein Avbf_08411 [Armadillidium vulgare]
MNVISPIPTGNRSNISSPVHLNYNQSVPVQTLYSGHLRNNGSNRELISSSSGRHASYLMLSLTSQILFILLLP